jgi:glycosyltransferase involved in cell wall biosynthesis
MMLGIPVVSSVCKDLVCGINCGVYVNYASDSIRNGIIRLRDNYELRAEMGANGRKAFEKENNWAIMEKKLLDIYANILQKKGRYPP